jgi:hypothetical protein
MSDWMEYNNGKAIRMGVFARSGRVVFYSKYEYEARLKAEAGSLL